MTDCIDYLVDHANTQLSTTLEQTTMAIQTETYTLPVFWAGALINGDESHMSDDDCKALDAFNYDMIKRWGQCWCIGVDGAEDDDDFRTYHDAHQYGVLACNVATFTFDTTPRFASHKD
jgi:hypothetical protein